MKERKKEWTNKNEWVACEQALIFVARRLMNEQMNKQMNKQRNEWITQCGCIDEQYTVQSSWRESSCTCTYRGQKLWSCLVKLLGSFVVNCLWCIVNHGIVAHQVEIILQGKHNSLQIPLTLDEMNMRWFKPTWHYSPVVAISDFRQYSRFSLYLP